MVIYMKRLLSCFKGHGFQVILAPTFKLLEAILELFIPLIVVNCIVLGRAEAFASKNTIFNSAIDGLGMGLGFTLSLTLLGIVREFLGNLSFLGMKFSPADGILVFVLAPGAFLALGLLLAIVNSFKNRKNA